MNISKYLSWLLSSVCFAAVISVCNAEQDTARMLPSRFLQIGNQQSQTFLIVASLVLDLLIHGNKLLSAVMGNMVRWY